jgi:MFS family permease
MSAIQKDRQFYKFALYGFLKNLNFSEPFIILFFRQEGLSFTAIGLLFSIRSVLVNVLEIPSGIFADGYGKRRAMMLCFAAYIASFLVFFLFHTLPFFILAIILFAVGEAFRTGTHKSLILEYLRQTGQIDLKLAYYGKTRSVSQIGMAVSAASAALMVFFSGEYRLLFLISIVPYTAGFFLMMSYPKSLDRTADIQEASSDKWKRYRDSFTGLLSLLRSPKSRRALLNFGFYGGTFKSVKDYIQPILVQIVLAASLLSGFEPEKRSSLLIGAVYIAIYLLASWSSNSSVRVSGAFRRQADALNVLFLISGVLIAGSGIFLGLALPAGAAAALVLLYVLYNIRRPMELSYISGLIPDGSMAAGLSGESQLQSLLTAVAAPLIGLAVDSLGLAAAMGITGAAVLLASGLFRCSRQEEGAEEGAGR